MHLLPPPAGGCFCHLAAMLEDNGRKAPQSLHPHMAAVCWGLDKIAQTLTSTSKGGGVAVIGIWQPVWRGPPINVRWPHMWMGATWQSYTTPSPAASAAASDIHGTSITTNNQMLKSCPAETRIWTENEVRLIHAVAKPKERFVDTLTIQ